MASKVKVLVTQLCPTLCNPMDCSPPGFSVHGILQARIPEWVTIPFSRGSSWGWNLSLLHSRWILYHLSQHGGPISLPLFVLCIIITHVPWRMTYITTNDDYAEDFILVTYKQLCELINEFILITLLDLPFCKKKKIFTLNSPICCSCLILQWFVRCLHVYTEVSETLPSLEISSLPPDWEMRKGCHKGLSFV